MRKKRPLKGLADRIRQVAVEHYGSPYGLAKALGGDHYKSAVSGWVNARRGLESSSLARLCQITGRSADWFLFGDPHPENLGAKRDLGNLRDELATAVAARAGTHAMRSQFVRTQVLESLRKTDLVAVLTSTVRDDIKEIEAFIDAYQNTSDTLTSLPKTTPRRVRLALFKTLRAPAGAVVKWKPTLAFHMAMAGANDLTRRRKPGRRRQQGANDGELEFRRSRA